MKSYKTNLLFFLLFSFPLFAFCGKPEVIAEETLSEEAQRAYDQFNDYANRGTIDEAFLFFTDPHLLGAYSVFDEEVRENFESSFDVAKVLYDTLSLGFCLCGGDWLRAGDTQLAAKEKLLFADKQMKELFDHYYKMMGNHDTNYQGIISSKNNNRGDLPLDFINKEYFSETGSAYYSFMGRKTLFYVLDSGLDWSVSMDDYRWEQIHWLAKRLLVDNSEHIGLCIHMFRIQTPTPMSRLIVELSDAYNANKAIKIKNELYDYSSTSGKIHFIIAGHNHEDIVFYVGEKSNIPVIQSCNFTIEGTKTFDICMVDYSNNMMEMIRVGFGDSREVQLLN